MTASEKKIKDSLLKQLAAKNAETAHFEDLIEDYMALYRLKNKLKTDIKKRGVKYETRSASGAVILKQNQSIKDLVAVNKQMLTILEKLGLTTDAPTGTESHEYDL